MAAAIRQVLDSFDLLPEAERLEAASEILRRTAHLEFPPLDDETLACAADAQFLALDEQESRDSNNGSNSE